MALSDADILAAANVLIERHEGFRANAYRDSRGNWTIGYGRCDPGVTEGMTCTQAEAQAWMDTFIAGIFRVFDAGIPWWRTLDAVRAAVLVDIAYNVGPRGFLGWRHTLGFVQAADWASASAELLATQPWAGEVGARATEDASTMWSGVLPA